MEMGLKKRKNTRLKYFDYNSIGAYFITMCTKDKRCILSDIVGTGVLDGPKIRLTSYGEVAEKYIKQLDDFYDNITVSQYVIMPNHIHLIIVITNNGQKSGPSGTPVPTVQNSVVSRFISTFKRFTNKEYGANIWQSRSYDHVIRDKHDYDIKMKYIYENPLHWYYDELYQK